MMAGDMTNWAATLFQSGGGGGSLDPTMLSQLASRGQAGGDFMRTVPSQTTPYLSDEMRKSMNMMTLMLAAGVARDAMSGGGGPGPMSLSGSHLPSMQNTFERPSDIYKRLKPQQDMTSLLETLRYGRRS